MNTISRFGVLATVSIAALCVAASGASAEENALAAEQKVSFDIPAQPLRQALFTFAQQSGKAVVARPEVTKDMRSDALHGSYTPQDGLRRLLESSGLNFTPKNDGAWRVTAELAAIRTAAVASGAQNRNDRSSAPLVIAQASVDSEMNETATRSGDNENRPDTIVVTGTQIRGQGPIGSPLLTIDRDAIDASGFTSADQLLKSVPLTFGGGPSEDTLIGDAVSNFTFGSSVNLRGLGADATLVLVNGRRLPTAGADANFFDISSISLSALERIEILADGASATYGTDAVAGVVNFILRNDYEGAETRLGFGTVTDGGLREYRASQLFGTKWDSGNALLSYEYYERGALENAERPFAANSDLTAFGGDNFGLQQSNPANFLNPLTGTVGFAIPSGQDGTNLAFDDLLPNELNLQNRREQADLLPSQTRHNVFATVNQELTDKIAVFAEGRASFRDFARNNQGFGTTLLVPSSNAFVDETFIEAVNGLPITSLPFAIVEYSFLDDLGPQRVDGSVDSYSAVLGFRADVTDTWQVEAFGAFTDESATQNADGFVNFPALNAALADSDPATAFNPFGDGSNTNPATIDAIRGFRQTSTDATVWSANVKADGSLFQLPAGDVKLAIGGAFRTEKYTTATLQSITGPGPEMVGGNPIDRDVFAAFGELVIPIFGEQNRRPAFERLDISVAGRFEDYSDFGSTTNPKVGFAWAPIEGLEFRGSYGTSFRAPNLTDIVVEGTRTVISGAIPDDVSPTGFTNVLIIQGNNDGLGPEEARTFTAGVQYTPSFLSGFTAEINFFDISFRDRISSPAVLSTILLQEDIFSSIITRDPSTPLVESLVTDPDFIGVPPPADTIGAVIDARIQNLSETEVQGLDFALRYGFETDFGTFNIESDASLLLGFEEAVTASSPSTDFVDTINNPVDLRVRSGILWSHNGFGANVFMNYVDGYTDNISSPERSIDSWTTFDLQVYYSTMNMNVDPWLQDLTFSVGVLNVFDEDPPFANNVIGVGYDPENADPLNRFISLQLTKAF